MNGRLWLTTVMLAAWSGELGESKEKMRESRAGGLPGPSWGGFCITQKAAWWEENRTL